MKLSAPIHVLKSKAKSLKKRESITMSMALDKIAQGEGFNSWSLLQSKSNEIQPSRYDDILGYFNPGDMVLVGARPGFGKTSFTIGLFVMALQEKRKKSFYFSLSETHKDVAGRIALYDQTIGQNPDLFELNYSNEISADFIIKQTKGFIREGAVIVIDYLQLLDEKRTNPPLQEQVEKLKRYAKETKCIIIFISQISRDVEYRLDQRPTDKDIRLPNPLETKLFNKMIFLFREKLETEKAEVQFLGNSKFVLNLKWTELKFQ